MQTQPKNQALITPQTFLLFRMTDNQVLSLSETGKVCTALSDRQKQDMQTPKAVKVPAFLSRLKDVASYLQINLQ